MLPFYLGGQTIAISKEVRESVSKCVISVVFLKNLLLIKPAIFSKTRTELVQQRCKPSSDKITAELQSFSKSLIAPTILFPVDVFTHLQEF